jgi:hypothetical protein
MQVVPFPARQARTHYRHEVRTLTYVTLDAANGGIIRNLNSEGVAVQAVAPLREQQRVRVRFELRFPRLRVETYGQVSWSNSSGQCGIRFVDLPTQTAQQIDEWIFSSLLDAIAREAAHRHSIFAAPTPLGEENVSKEHDGLTLSSAPRPAIRIEAGYAKEHSPQTPYQLREETPDLACDSAAKLNWLSRPLSGKTLAWMIDGLVMIAGLLLFSLIFLSITHELPPWPWAMGAASSAALFVAAAYWVLFGVFGGASLGARLADAASGFNQEEEDSHGTSHFG